MQLRLEGDHVDYSAAGGESWSVPITDIRVVGEFLSRQHRGSENHFLVFMTREEWFKAPYDADGREAFLAQLGARLNHPLRPDLFKSTTFSSRVLWPTQLEGRPLFELIPEERAQNIVTRIRQLLVQNIDMRFTDEVRKELGQA